MQIPPPQSVQVTVISRLRSPSFRQRFLELSQETKMWLEQQPGFLRYELFETAEGWMDTMLWQDRAMAKQGNAAFAKTSISAAFMEIIEPDYKGFVGTHVLLVDSQKAPL